ncbi:UNVERIFIED_ORG: hypothetical protein J2X79_002005 [Arthrobacter globiformis]|nr:hypothetical protein [Arthrobacter globiformis]
MVNQSKYSRAQTTRRLKSTRAMTLTKTLSAFGVAAALLLTGFVAPAQAATVYKAPLRTAVRALSVLPENNAGYDRTRYFGDWKDANGDCQNTRHEVLIHETKAAPTYSSRLCTVTRGKWVTTWDNRIHTSPTTVQIDHTVPVAEAWGSGARSWTQARRVAFYNDLGDGRTLSTQTSALNASKQASGPEAWLPPAKAYRCTYIAEWVAVKIRWGLRVDSAEKAQLTRWANACPNITLTVTKV